MLQVLVPRFFVVRPLSRAVQAKAGRVRQSLILPIAGWALPND